jgi:hypothetical protein
MHPLVPRGARVVEVVDVEVVDEVDVVVDDEVLLDSATAAAAGGVMFWDAPGWATKPPLAATSGVT